MEADGRGGEGRGEEGKGRGGEGWREDDGWREDERMRGKLRGEGREGVLEGVKGCALKNVLICVLRVGV